MQEGLLDHFDGHALELYVADCSKHLGDPVCVAGIPYASGAIRSTQSFRYGYAEIKWNLTLLSGEHPSFWLLPAEGGPAFELDVPSSPATTRSRSTWACTGTTNASTSGEP